MAHILIAEDDPDVSNIFTRFLTHLGHTCQVARDGYGALAYLDTQAFDLLITDLDLPQLSGVALIQLLESRPCRPPILVSSGHGIPGEIAVIVEGVLAKPFYLDQLTALLAELLTSAHNRAA
jgi:two-component system alkaline phosphatase synthesis response regulator PhoP